MRVANLLNACSTSRPCCDKAVMPDHMEIGDLEGTCRFHHAFPPRLPITVTAVDGGIHQLVSELSPAMICPSPLTKGWRIAHWASQVEAKAKKLSPLCTDLQCMYVCTLTTPLPLVATQSFWCSLSLRPLQSCKRSHCFVWPQLLLLAVGRNADLRRIYYFHRHIYCR